MRLVSLFFDFFSAGLYSQYIVSNAPLGFQHPASIAFNNIIDFHDYIVLFLIFIFILVLWHLVWALNLSSLFSGLVYVYLMLIAHYRFVTLVFLSFKKSPVVAGLLRCSDYLDTRDLLQLFRTHLRPNVHFSGEAYLDQLSAFFMNSEVLFARRIGVIIEVVVAFFVSLVVSYNAAGSYSEFMLMYGFGEGDFTDNAGVVSDLFVAADASAFFFKSWIESSLLSLNTLKVAFNARYLTHAPYLEIFWTVFPSFILLAIAIPSLILLYQLDAVEPLSLSIKVIGHQWYWTYEIGTAVALFQDLLPFRKLPLTMTFDSYMLIEASSDLRLLEVDNPLFVPVDVPLTFLVTSADVLHSWAVPSLGIKVDAIPGRLNQVGVTVLEGGVFYGQCSELCGINHGFMPINIHSYYNTPFNAW